MSEPTNKQPDRSHIFSPLWGPLAVLIGITILAYLIVHRDAPRQAHHVVCLANLKSLSAAVALYADANGGEYPSADKWCDLLIDRYALERAFKCPVGGKERCDYAMNPRADRWSAPDVVLLFESASGWNQSGGPELLKMRHREGRGCNVLFVNGSVESIKAEEIPRLRWEGKADERTGDSASANVRRPIAPDNMKYWLQNMIWYHRFGTRDVQAATGLQPEAIYAAQEEYGINLYTRPERPKDAPLLVLPYPGGRHPRVGFLEGAVEPQRETKFSVFTPWDRNSYVVVDVPEAIWSNLGLTYLAHTHIDTIWTKQGIDLPRLEWNRRADGSLDIERVLPNGIAFGVKAAPDREAVRMEMWLRNGSIQRLTDLRVQICVMPKMAVGFAAQTNENKVFTNPYVACRSEDGKRWIITAWEGCHRPWGNKDCPCFHSDPKFPDLEPGREHRLHGWLSFFEGEDIQAEFARIEALAWIPTSPAAAPRD